MYMNFKYDTNKEILHTAMILVLQNCTPTASVPGDGIDNDCDNRIDEELCPDGNGGYSFYFQYIYIQKDLKMTFCHGLFSFFMSQEKL